MPTYVYRCKSCEHEFETIQAITDEPVKKCPKCEGKVAKLLFPVGIVFKGSGFHVNDYPSSKSATSKNGKKEDTAKPETNKETAESKG